jgi:hypothetical protein
VSLILNSVLGTCEGKCHPWFVVCVCQVGLTLEMAPLCGSHFQLVACLAKICTGLCGVSAGATRATIVVRGTLRGNNALSSMTAVMIHLAGRTTSPATTILRMWRPRSRPKKQR